MAGLTAGGLFFLLLHYAIFHAIVGNVRAPDDIFAIFRWFYAYFGATLVVPAVLNMLSGLFIQKRTNRTFSLVVAAINCLCFPFGTILGVFTFVVLLRTSVRDGYQARLTVAASI